MRDPIPRGPFDQGLFLTHFNKGRDLYDAQRYEEAEQQLEEAYLLRPRDQKVLNLLGLVYFRQEKFEKAEEVYRKLVADSPDAHTLHYNLGLIHFKLDRLEESETSFLKALELTKDNPKINFYLGSIYERLQRFKDAIYQYRVAGANIMVRRVEDKIAAATPGRSGPHKDDTAEFKDSPVRRAAAAEGRSFDSAKTLRPVSPSLMAGEALSTSDDARAPSAPTRPGRETAPPGPFRLLEANLLEANFAGKVFIKQGTLYSYSGNLTFWVKEKRPGAQSTLVIITGTGKVLLTDQDRQITPLMLDGDAFYVEPTHLLACEEGVTPRYVRIGEALDFLALDGKGMLALSTARPPFAIAVTPDLPASVPLSSVIMWSGELSANIVEDREIHEVMLGPGTPAGGVLRLEGTGRVLVEHTASLRPAAGI